MGEILMSFIAPIWWCFLVWMSTMTLLININMGRSEPVIAFGVMVVIVNITMLVRSIWREGE